jgi:hypothetical protein
VPEPTADDMIRMATQLLDSADLLAEAEKRMAAATQMIRELGTVAGVWEDQAQDARNAARAEALRGCATQVREIVSGAAKAMEVPGA